MERAVRQSEYLDLNKILDKESARLLFNITDLLVNLEGKDRATLLLVLGDMMKKLDQTVNLGIFIPVTQQQANRICLRGRHSVMSNFPHEEVFVINGHACISLDEKISAMMFHGVAIDWMQDADGNINDQLGINATPAARHLLDGMREGSNNRPNTAYGWMVKWSDGFLRSFVCQVRVILVSISFICSSINVTNHFC